MGQTTNSTGGKSIMTYDLIGTIYKETGKTLTDSEGYDYPEMSPVSGYHVNVLSGNADTASYSVYAATPSRVFAGRDDTIFLKFQNRDEWSSLGIEVEHETEL